MKVRIFPILVMFFFLGQMKCGGPAKPVKGSLDYCKNELSLIKEQEVCDPITIEQFENRIKDWQHDCIRFASYPEKTQVNENLTNSLECSEKKRQQEAQRRQCSKSVDAVAQRKECIGDKCVSVLKEINDLILQCSSLEADEQTLKSAKTLLSEIEEIIEQEKQVIELQSLEKKCTQSKAHIEEGKTKQALDQILLELEKNEAVKLKIKEGSKVHKVRESTLASCGEAVKGAVESLTNAISEELSNKKLKRKPNEWMSRFSGLEELSKQLNEIEAAKLFPGSMEALNKALEKHKKTKDKQEQIANKRRITKARKVLTKGTKKCKKLVKYIKNFEYKTQSYKQKGNEKKSNAYKTKLDKAKQDLATLNEEIKKSIETKVLPEKNLKAILGKLEKAGCPASEPSVSE
ncbi:MAG: hypothetical protein GY847_24025 [Proteobacteria bacterium]|nr:hypothetical protein [Pseudomonadota bacterium]